MYGILNDGRNVLIEKVIVLLNVRFNILFPSCIHFHSRITFLLLMKAMKESTDGSERDCKIKEE